MRLISLAAGAALAMASLGAGSAIAQNADPRAALASRLGATSCGSFAGLTHRAQVDLVRRMARSAPPQSLVSGTISSTMSNGANRPTGSVGNDSTVPGTPLSAGELIAACQAASPRASLRDAYSQFNSGSNELVDDGR